MMTVISWGAKKIGHPSVGQICPGCGEPFEVGQFTAGVPIGPGDDEFSRERARAGVPYPPIFIEVHFACATGWEKPR